jgi:PhoH-like ATPase
LQKIFVSLLGFFLVLNSFCLADVPRKSGECARTVKVVSLNLPIYIIDTNILLSHPNILDELSDKTIIIPRSVIRELDRQKNLNDDRSRTSRAISIQLRKLLETSKDGRTDLARGGTLEFAEVSKNFEWPDSLDPKTADDRIIALGLERHALNRESKIIILSNDNNLAILAKSLGLETSLYESSLNSRVSEEILSTPLVVPTLDKNLNYLSEPTTTTLSLERAWEFGLPKDIVPHENQFISFESQNASNLGFDLQETLSLIWRFHTTSSGKQVFAPVHRKEIMNLVIKPRNKEQVMAADLLLDSRIRLVSLSGPAGTGKTLLTLAAGMSQSEIFAKKAAFKRIILTRPNQVTGSEMGYLPGSLSEKMAPFMGPFKDNFAVFVEAYKREHLRIANGIERETAKMLSSKDLVSEKNSVKELVERIMTEIVSVEAITFSRGRSWDDTLLIIDEAQNLTLHETKTIITRAGEGTKVVLLGDVDQIDNKVLNLLNNGLVITASRFRGKNLAGHVSLTQGERSELATMASELLK